MPKSTHTNKSAILQYRKKLGENQSDFWKRFGVTQSGGSRYESGRKIPLPTACLIDLFQNGTISEEQIQQSQKRMARKANR